MENLIITSMTPPLKTCDELYNALIVKILPECALIHSFKVEFRPRDDQQFSKFKCDHDNDNGEKLLTCSFLYGEGYKTYNQEEQCIPESQKDKLKNIQIIFKINY